MTATRSLIAFLNDTRWAIAVEIWRWQARLERAAGVGV